MDETLLIGVGAQKAGTTWLAEYLRDCQPSAHFPGVKEVHFFDNYCMPNYGSYFEEQRQAQFEKRTAELSKSKNVDSEEHRELEAQRRRFEAIHSPENYMEFLNYQRKDQRILCDFTPDYALLDVSGFKLMKNVHDNVKLVFILRNPADRFWSSLRFNQTHNTHFDIEANFDTMLVRQDFVRFANYDRTIRAMLENFDQSDLHVLFFENLFSDATIKNFCNWLGLPFVRGNYARRSNAALTSQLSEDRRRQIVIAYQQTYREIDNRFDGALPEKWKNDMIAYLPN